MEVPPQSLHWLLTRSCSQMEVPPHVLLWSLCRPCSQMLPPPQSLHLLLRLLCSQMEARLLTLHLFFCLSCGHFFPCFFFFPPPCDFGPSPRVQCSVFGTRRLNPARMQSLCAILPKREARNWRPVPARSQHANTAAAAMLIAFYVVFIVFREKTTVVNWKPNLDHHSKVCCRGCPGRSV